MFSLDLSDVSPPVIPVKFSLYCKRIITYVSYKVGYRGDFTFIAYN